MSNEELLKEIREANLTYLLLARQMLAEDRAAALFRLGIHQELAELLERLTPSQLSRIAQSNMLLFRPRCDDRMFFELLADEHRPAALAQTHAAIVAAGRSPDPMR